MNNTPQKIKTILNKVKERNLTHITTVYFDHHGKPRGKYYHAQSLRKALLEGMALNLGVFSIAVNEKQMRNSVFLDPRREFRDGLLRLDASSCRDFPLDQNGRGLLLLGELADEYRAYCCRALLAAELRRYEAMGMTPRGAFETEWYMLQDTARSTAETSPARLRAAPGFESFYSFTEQVAANEWFEEIKSVCETMNMPVESLHNEFDTLVEAALLPARGLQIADNAALFKALIKTLAKKRGLTASFMARRDANLQGCGAHVNLALLDGDGESGLFYDDKRPHCLAETLLWFVGGLQTYTPELFLLHCPNLNSFRRLRPGLFAPLRNNWGINNKTTACRVVNTSRDAARIEFRLPGADVNPYLSLLGMLIAGRKGVEERLQPAQPTQGDGWSAADADAPAYPQDFPAAIVAFDRSELAREVLGDAFVDCFVAGRQWQLDDLAATITDWETRCFLEGA